MAKIPREIQVEAKYIYDRDGYTLSVKTSDSEETQSIFFARGEEHLVNAVLQSIIAHDGATEPFGVSICQYDEIDP